MIYPTTGVHAWTFSATMKTFFDDRQKIFDNHAICKESGPNLDINRNYVVKRFLDDTDRDYLMFIDADMKWDTQELYTFIKKAHKQKLEIATGLYKKIDYATGTTSYAYWFLDGSPVPLDIGEGTDYVEVGAVPAGALLLHRSALVKMRQTFGDEWFSTDSPGMREDMRFCDRAAVTGIKIYVDPEFKMGHIKSVVIPG